MTCVPEKTPKPPGYGLEHRKVLEQKRPLLRHSCPPDARRPCSASAVAVWVQPSPGLHLDQFLNETRAVWCTMCGFVPRVVRGSQGARYPRMVLIPPYIHVSNAFTYACELES